MNYRKKCPFCEEKLVVEDIDYRFDGCQDEMLVCPKCNITFEFKVRYGKVCKKYEYSKGDSDKWEEKYL